MDVLSGPLPQAPLTGPPGHDAMFYSDDDFMIDGMQSHLRRAVDGGDGAFCIATKQHLSALAPRFGPFQSDMDAAAEQGRYVVLDVNDAVAAITANGELNESCASEFFGNILNKMMASIQHENPRVFSFGESSAILWARGRFDDVLRMEQWATELVQEQPVAICCAYPVQIFNHPRDTEYLGTICSEHSAIIAPENIAPWAKTEPEPTEVLEDGLLAENRRLLESGSRLSYPSWQGEYEDAVMEVDKAHLFKKVEIAQAAVLNRLHEFQYQTDHATERHQLMTAWRVLQIIKQEKLGFIE
ncbi:MAG TPA: MEDS domain-containing protein [Terriglobales bacterium]|nr:MEDS domain-containing protein [Terriglobales bacterium]